MENSSRALIIRYNNKLNGSILYKCSDGIIPKEIEETKLLFIMTYPNILKELIKGKILYIDNYTGYLGDKEIKGLYGEEEIFIPEYTSNNLSLIEIIIDIENKIKNNKKKIRK